jgi:uncharacterized protein
MKRERKAVIYLRSVMIILALVLPAFSLIPLGSLWLWERGYLLYWIVAALALSAISYLVQVWFVRDLQPAAAANERAGSPDSEHTSDTPQEAGAWDAVERLANSADPAKLVSRDAFLDLGLQTIEAVARSMHPQDEQPLWRFTVPEALALIERISRELRPFVIDNIPLGERLTVGQVMKFYRFRSAIDVAEQAYDLWRVVRVLNPVTAATSEARERLTKRLYSGLRDELAARLTKGYVREVGRAAIDLYGGRLRVSNEELDKHVSRETQRDLKSTSAAEPIRILIAGQVGAGKSSLINALLKELHAAVDVLPATQGFTAYSLTRQSPPNLLLIDSPGASSKDVIDRIANETGSADLILWVMDANRADRHLDRVGIEAIRAHFTAKPDRRQPPLLGVATHIDQLKPARDWSPPYDLNDTTNAKVRSIHEVMDLIANEVGLPSESLVPVSFDPNGTTVNIDGLWLKLEALLPDATRANLLRRLRGASTAWSWSKLWSQTKGIARTARNEATNRDGKLRGKK